MGCASSDSSRSCSGEGTNSAVRLPSSKVHFEPEQLDKLGDYFRELARSEREESAHSAGLEARVERLVQRLLAGLAILDRRFASCLLLSLNERSRVKQSRFEYLLRLDALSGAGRATLEEDGAAPGFARLRLEADEALAWSGLLGPEATLRRDLVKGRVAALLAQSLRPAELGRAADGIDENLCVTPGQVVDADVLHHIMQQPQHCRVFYGPAERQQLADIADERVAIVEDEDGILLKLGLNGSKSPDIRVRLLIGVSMDCWPSCLDYPERIPLYHCDALLHYGAAQSGVYLVAAGPQQELRCDDKASLWRIRLFAAERLMREHYSDESVVSLTEDALTQILDQLRRRRALDFSLGCKGQLRLISRHMLRAIHWWSLEQRGASDPLKHWSPESLARHVLLSLDELLRAARTRQLRCYFQARCNLMLQCARGGRRAHAEACASDAQLLEAYLSALHGRSLGWAGRGPRVPGSSEELLERELLWRWRRLVRALPRPECCGPRQLHYLGLLLREVLRARDSLQHQPANHSSACAAQRDQRDDDLTYLLNLLLRQAEGQQRGAFCEGLAERLVALARENRDTFELRPGDATALAQALLRCLHLGLQTERGALRSLLQLYLRRLTDAALEYAWHAEAWCARHEVRTAETRSLAAFCARVQFDQLRPGAGLAKALRQGRRWPKQIMRRLEHAPSCGLQLVVVGPQRIFRFQLQLAEDQRPVAPDLQPGSARDRLIAAGDSLLASLRRRTTEQKAESGASSLVLQVAAPSHLELRDASPLTLAAVAARRRGRQRGPAGLVAALVSLNKFRLLQEAAQVLPAEERRALLDLLRRASREAAREQVRRASCPDPASSVAGPRQLYTARSESQLERTWPGDEQPAAEATGPRQQQPLLERELQLRREIHEIHDSLTRGLRCPSQVGSWAASSASSTWLAVARGRHGRRRAAIWDKARGRLALWDSLGTCAPLGPELATPARGPLQRSAKGDSPPESPRSSH